jgi:hypothetical protein
MPQSLIDRAINLLDRWASAVEPFWNGDDDLGCYGPGYIHWGIQSNWNYAAGMATLAHHGPAATTDHWRGRALAALRFALATHITGNRAGNDGRKWGHSWISMLGIERGMHGVPYLEAYLTEADRSALRRVLMSEANWLLTDAHRGDQAGLVAGMWNASGQNVPESNIWSGALLWRTAQRYPDDPNASAWRERAHDYFVNGISVPRDGADERIVAGRSIAERHVGANFFPSYALDHHGYLNVGYMVICVSNAAMLYFDMRRAGLPVPDSLLHHQPDLWEVLRRMIFGNGRLARIGGDSRVRYSYCQEYLLPSLLFAADALGDVHALGLAERQVDLIEREMGSSSDGTFYGARMSHMRRDNPHYFTRLESDRACALSMLATYLPITRSQATSDGFESSVAGGWIAPTHGAVLHRSPSRLASFSWRARGLTQALCLPPSDDGAVNGAEWALNLAPVVRFMGDEGDVSGRHRRLLTHTLVDFPGGFATCGSVMEGVDVSVDEGALCTDQAVSHVAFAALPDDHTCVGLQLVIAAEDRVGYLAEVKGLHLNIANDLFNGFRRVVLAEDGEHVLVSPPAFDEFVMVSSPWLNIDNVLGISLVYGAQRLLIDRGHERRGGAYHSLHVEEVFAVPPSSGREGRRGGYRRWPGGWGVTATTPRQVLIDLGYAVLSGLDAESTRCLESGSLALAHELVRGVWVRGADGCRYAVVANFSRDAVTIQIGPESVSIDPGHCHVGEMTG